MDTKGGRVFNFLFSFLPPFLVHFHFPYLAPRLFALESTSLSFSLSSLEISESESLTANEFLLCTVRCFEVQYNEPPTAISL
jgi:hypothetical protein